MIWIKIALKKFAASSKGAKQLYEDKANIKKICLLDFNRYLDDTQYRIFCRAN